MRVRLRGFVIVRAGRHAFMRALCDVDVIGTDGLWQRARSGARTLAYSCTACCMDVACTHHDA